MGLAVCQGEMLRTTHGPRHTGGTCGGQYTSPYWRGQLPLRMRALARTSTWRGSLALRSSSGEVLACRADGQRGVQDTLLLPQVIGEPLNFRGRSANEDHFGAQIMVEMDVCGSQDGVIMVMLQLDEFFAELTDVMVIDQGHRPQRFLLSTLPFMHHEVIPDHIAHEFRAVRVALLLH